MLAAIDEGSLDRARLRSYQKLQRELEFGRRRTDKVAQREEKRKWKRVHKENRKRMRERDRWR